MNLVQKYQEGKLPPMDIQLEVAVLGAILMESHAMVQLGDTLSENVFYKESHKLIFRAIQSLYSRAEAIDFLTVVHELKKAGDLEKVGGAMYVTELGDHVSSGANIELHVRILKQHYIKRFMSRLGGQIVQSSMTFEKDPFDILEEMQAGLLEVMQEIDNGRSRHFKDILKDRFEEISEKMKVKNHLTGIDTGFTDINTLTGGWQSPDLIILAARPAMGKTALALNFLTACARSGQHCAMFSLEMSEKQLTDRVMSQETHLVSASNLGRGKLSQDQFEHLLTKANDLYSFNIHIDDTPGLSINQLRSKAYKLKMQHDIKFIVVDYLQLMSADTKGNREQEISQISRGLKKMAKELEMPVLALSQLSRAVETRGGEKRPQLSDLRESGAIEQDADIVIFLHRPEYYGITEDEHGNSMAGKAEIIFSKHRNGGLDTIMANFNARFTDFKDVETNGLTMDQPTSYMSNSALPRNADPWE